LLGWPPWPCVRLVILQTAGVGLDDMAILQEQKPSLLRWHLHHEGIGLIEDSAKSPHDRRRINRFGGDDITPLLV
jgi:hypothetical protein